MSIPSETHPENTGKIGFEEIRRYNVEGTNEVVSILVLRARLQWKTRGHR